MAPTLLRVTDFCDRIKMAMTQQTWEPDAVVLRSKWAAKYGAAKTPSRQTFYLWLKAKKPKIDIVNLYLMSDLFEVNARWLALGPPVPITKPLVPDEQLQILIDAYQNLQPELRSELISESAKLLRIQGVKSRANPY